VTEHSGLEGIVRVKRSKLMSLCGKKHGTADRLEMGGAERVKANNRS
jgi:hypothetical protein